MRGGGGGEEKGSFLSFSSLPFSLPSSPFSPETPDTQATSCWITELQCTRRSYDHFKFLQHGFNTCTFDREKSRQKKRE